MGQRERNWLLGELPTWVAEGVVDAAAAERLRQRYAAHVSGRSWGMIVCGVLGALLVGAGVILVLAHNWDRLSRPLRTAHSFAPLLMMQALIVLGFVRGWSGTAWRETTGLLWTAAIGACMALIGQTYHLSGDTESFLLSWAVLALPVVWLSRAVSALAVFLGLALAWASIDKLDDGVALLFWSRASARSAPARSTPACWS